MRTISTILLIINLSFVYGQKQSFSKDSLVEKRIIELSDSVILLKSQFQEIKEKQEWHDEVLNERLKQASDTISNQNSLLDSFGVLYTIITIIMAHIGIVLPILTYQFGIKPSQDALKEFEKNADNKIKTYLKETRQAQIKKSIEHLRGDNIELKGQAISFLSLTQHEGFTDQELFDFYRLIKSGKLSETHIGTVAYLLGSRVNEYANDVFGDIELLKVNAIKSSAFQYIPKVGFKNFIQPLKKLLNGNTNQYGEFYTLLIFSNMNDENSALEILNSCELVDTLTVETLKTTKNTIESSLQHLKITEKEFKETYLYKKIEKASLK
jgi:hypothetical protein